MSTSNILTKPDRVEERLHEYERVVEDLQEMIAVVDRNYRYLIANRAFLSYRGLQRGQVVGRTVAEVLDNEYFDLVVKEKLDGCFAGKSIKYELTSTYSKLGRRILSVSYQPIEGPAGVDRVACVLEDITERRRAEAALRGSERQYRSLFENMLNGFAYGRMHFKQGRPQDFTFLGVNKAFGTLTGLKNVVGRKASEVIPGILESDPDLLELYGRVAQTGAPERIEMYVKGLQTWFDLHVYSPAKGHFVAVFDVITSRKQAEVKIQQLSNRLLLATRAATIGIWDYDCLKDELVWDDSMYRLNGISPQHFTGDYEAWRTSVHPADQTRMNEEAQMALRGEKDFDTEFRVLWPDKSVHHLKTIGMVQRDDSGQPIRMLGTNWDVTERKREEGHLRLLSAALEATANSVMITDREGVILWINAAFSQLTGYSSPEACGRKPSLLKSGVHPLAFYQNLWRTICAGKVWQAEMVNRRKDGSLYTEDNTITPVRDEQGRIVHFISVKQDITERKRAEEALLLSGQQLRALTSRVEMLREEERTRISREIHDVLGQMLTGIKMDLSWMEHRLDEFGDDRRVNPILDKLVVTAELADATVKAVQRIAAELRPGILDKLGLPIALEYWAAEFKERNEIPCRVVVSGASVALQPQIATAFFRIFQEALTNVSRHAEATAVEVAFQQDHEGCRLEIQDNGKGMAGVDLGNPKALGLLGMHERANLLGGGTWFTPRPGGGTIVTIWIPNPPVNQQAV